MYGLFSNPFCTYHQFHGKVLKFSNNDFVLFSDMMNCVKMFSLCCTELNSVFARLRAGIAEIIEKDCNTQLRVLAACNTWQIKLKRKISVLMSNCSSLKDCVECWRLHNFELSDIQDEVFCNLTIYLTDAEPSEAENDDVDSLFLPSPENSK